MTYQEALAARRAYEIAGANYDAAYEARTQARREWNGGWDEALELTELTFNLLSAEYDVLCCAAQDGEDFEEIIRIHETERDADEVQLGLL